jgi:hypothetical protein
LPYRLTDEGTAIGLYEIQQRYQTDENYLLTGPTGSRQN